MSKIEDGISWIIENKAVEKQLDKFEPLLRMGMYNEEIKKDFIQEIYLALLEYSLKYPEKWCTLTTPSKLNGFIYILLRNQRLSKTSDCYKKLFEYENKKSRNDFAFDDLEEIDYTVWNVKEVKDDIY